ncbi:MAG: M14 family metallopeptidase [Candidatus Latescibacterota bacterium]
MTPQLLLTALFLPAVLAAQGRAQADLALRTRPETTAYEQTSRYEDVTAFLQQAAAATPRLRLTHFGYSAEGRPLPLAVFGRVDGADSASVRAAGGVRVLLQGSIHAGEVDGKEALLVLLRDLAAGQHAGWADSLVLLVVPIYNADGNERLRPERAGQHGPFGGMGQRATGEGFDLNRDYVKLDAPESWAMVRLLCTYDPHVVVDLHTSDGTYHGYHLTYSPPLHPHTAAPLVTLLREELFPEVTRHIDQRCGWDYYYYGNLPPPHAGNLAWVDLGTAPGWYTYDHRARYSTNYAGLRNRLGILSESYSYLTFAERIRASLLFVEEILEYVHAHASRVRAAVEAADAHGVVGEDLVLRATHQRSAEPVEILLGEVTEELNPYSGRTVLRRRDVQHPVRIPEYGTFVATETTQAPRAYYLPGNLVPALRLVEGHGVRTALLAEPLRSRVERFRVDSVSVAAEAYEGHRLCTVFGAWEAADTLLPAGTVEVPVAQPLGRLACYLLEPRADDSASTWGLLGEALPVRGIHPIVRSPARR